MAIRFKSTVEVFEAPDSIDATDPGADDVFYRATARGIAHGKVRDTEGEAIGHPSQVYVSNEHVEADLRRVAKLFHATLEIYQREWRDILARAERLSDATWIEEAE